MEYELEYMRLPRSKHFSLGKDKYRCLVYQHDIHYRTDNDKFKDIDLTPSERETYFENTTASYKVKISKERVEVIFNDHKGGSGRVCLVSASNKHPLNINPVRLKNKITYKDVTPDIDIELVLKPRSVEWYKVLKGSKAKPNFEWLIEKGEVTVFHIRDRHEGVDAKKRGMELVKETKNRVIKEDGSETFTIIESFTGRVAVVKDKRTRVKQWKEEVAYPARIDLSISAEIESGANNYNFEQLIEFTPEETTSSSIIDAYRGTISVGAQASRTYEYTDYYTYMSLKSCGCHFGNFGLPTLAIIDSATLKWYTMPSSEMGDGVPFKLRGHLYGSYIDPPSSYGTWNTRPRTVAEITGTFTTLQKDTTYTFNVTNICNEMFQNTTPYSWASSYPMEFFLEQQFGTSPAAIRDALLTEETTETLTVTRVWTAAGKGQENSDYFVSGASGGGPVLDIEYTLLPAPQLHGHMWRNDDGSQDAEPWFYGVQYEYQEE